MPDRLWSDADRELVADLVRALPPPPSLPGAIGGLGPSPEEFADDVLDALTAAGWRRHNLPDITEAAIAYVDAPEGSDECAQRWYELKAVVEHWRAVDARPTGGTDG